MIRRVAIVTLIVGSALAATNGAQAAVLSNSSVPIGVIASVPCANGGIGDTVILSGDLHMLATTTFDLNGGVHLTTLFNAHDVSGVGAVSGTTYRGVGATVSMSDTNVGTVTAFVNNFIVVGTSGAATFQVHENIAVVVNASGTVTATVDNLRVTCG